MWTFPSVSLKSLKTQPHWLYVILKDISIYGLKCWEGFVLLD